MEILLLGIGMLMLLADISENSQILGKKTLSKQAQNG